VECSEGTFGRRREITRKGIRLTGEGGVRKRLKNYRGKALWKSNWKENKIIWTRTITNKIKKKRENFIRNI
jgi:hypothetical protein